MTLKYPHLTRAAQLKRWQPLVHHKKADVRFLTILIPIIETLYQSLRESLKTMPNLRSRLSDARLANHLRQDVIQLFLPMITKCCVIEMHKQKINKALNGATPEERFNDFIAQCTQKDMYHRLWETYPVLLTCVEIKATQYQAALLEFFQHLDNDIPTLETSLLQNNIARFTQFNASGDTHRQCRRVFIVTAQSDKGSQLRFVYKPRSLSNERYFSELCEWYNQTHTALPLKTAHIIDRDTYGYCEFITYQPCDNKHDINAFYHALGEISALLLVINGLDIHHENLIAHGSHPVLIDMECIMTPVLKANEHTYPNVGQSLILPRQTNINKKSKGVDISGLSDNDNQRSWRKAPRWHQPGTDEMHLVREDSEFKTQGNTPRIRNQAASPITHFKEDYIAGFQAGYQTLLAHRETLLSDQSPLFQDKPITTRYLFRSTSDYAILLHESYHPLLLDDSKKYAEHIDWLNEILPYRPYYQSIVVSEREDILNGDIPYFESRANASIIYDSKLQSVPCDLAHNGEEQCRRMLNSFSTEHLSTQCQLINFSFIAYEWNKKSINELQEQKKTSASQMINCQEVIQHLSDRATIQEGFISWPQLSFDEHQSWVSDLSGFTFYNGTIGIAFTLAHWDRFHQCSKSRMLTEKILESCYQVLSDHPAIGFGLNGYAGLLYAAHHIHQCDYPLAGSLVELLIKHSQSTPSHHDETFDVMGGISHDITTLLHFSNHYDIDEHIIHDKMAHLKDQCSEPATFCHDEDSTFEDGTKHPPLLSYAHGIAGAAIAYSRYAKRFNDDFSKDWVFKTADLLDHYFDHDQGYWPDMRLCSDARSLSEVTAQPPAWCGGHIGIGLFYIECYEQWPELKERAKKRLEDCVKLSQKITHQDSLLPNLCCGFYGDLDFLLELNKRLPKVVSQPTQPIIDKLIEKLPACEFEPNFISLFRGMPSFLYCHLRAQKTQDMPSAIYW